MFKLIFFLVGLAAAIVFSALNIGNTSDVSFGFTVLHEIPVFLSISISFLAGAVFTLPFAFFVSLNNKRKKKEQNQKAAKFIDDIRPDDFIPEDLKPVDE